MVGVIRVELNRISRGKTHDLVKRWQCGQLRVVDKTSDSNGKGENQ